MPMVWQYSCYSLVQSVVFLLRCIHKVWCLPDDCFTSYVGYLKPTHKKLLDYVIPRVASKWHELGIELYKDADVPRLDTIQREFPGNFTKACTEMLTYWLNTYTNATWDRLIKALREPGLQLNAIALDIMRDVIQG